MVLQFNWSQSSVSIRQMTTLRKSTKAESSLITERKLYWRCYNSLLRPTVWITPCCRQCICLIRIYAIIQWFILDSFESFQPLLLRSLSSWMNTWALHSKKSLSPLMRNSQLRCWFSSNHTYCSSTSSNLTFQRLLTMLYTLFSSSLTNSRHSHLL